MTDEQIIINEEWRPIDNYIDYQISNIGRLRHVNGTILTHVNGTILTQQTDSEGFNVADVYKDNSAIS